MTTLMRAIWIIVLPIIALLISVLFLGLFRKITARIQRRYGPPIYQPVIDLVKLFTQHSNISHGLMFDAGLIIALAGSVVTVLLIPAGGIHPLSSSGDLLVIIYLMLIPPIGMALSAGTSGNPNASLGVSRKLILALGYEVPFLLVLLTVMTYTETTSLLNVVQMQAGSILSWGVFRFPLAALATFLILPVMLGVRPFDIVGAPQEISSGPQVEFGGKYLAFATVEHALHIFIVIALFVDLFLGGAANLGTFFLKMLVVFLIGVFIGAVYPRFRIDQALRYCWKWPTLIALVGLILVVAIGG